MKKICGAAFRPIGTFSPVLFASLLGLATVTVSVPVTGYAAENAAPEAAAETAPAAAPAAAETQEMAPADAGMAFLSDFTGRALKSIQGETLTDEQRSIRIRELLLEGFAVDDIAEFVLGRYRKNLSPEQMASFRDTYLEYILASYSGELAALGKVDFTLLEAQAQPDGDVAITSEVKRDDGPPVRVGWQVTKGDDGKWRINDVKAEGVSLIVTQRAEFNSVLRSKKFEGLMDALNKKIAMSKKK